MDREPPDPAAPTAPTLSHGGAVSPAGAPGPGRDQGPPGTAGTPGEPVERIAPSRVGHFVLLERLGVGGMGVVYAAYDERLERKVALKLIRARAAEPAPRAQRRLLHEARSLARLSHPNVVMVHEVGELPGGDVFVAMELVKGTTLRQWQADRPWRAIVAMYRQAGAGLAAAHRAGIVHGDVKPDNVLVGDDGRARVVDFGLARLDQERAAPGAFAGTPGYMAPEQVRGGTHDRRSDQFGFCVALYEAVYGCAPFEQHAFGGAAGPERAPRPAQVHAGWLWAALERGLAVAPAGRFPSMDALLAALAPVEARPARRAWALAALSLAAGAAGVLVTAPAGSPCSLPGDALAGVWDAALRQRVEAALAATGLPFAGAVWQRVAATLDGYAEAWLHARLDACRATHEQHTQSPELLDLRMECLDDRKRSLQAVTGVLLEQPAQAADRADDLLGNLSDIALCADTRVLRLGPAPPADAGALARLEEARVHLAVADARLAARDAAGAGAAIESGMAVAPAYAPVQAEILALRGRLALEQQRIEQGVELLRAAVDGAMAARHDELVADAWLSLAVTAAPVVARPEQARDWLRHAGAALQRLDHRDDPRLLVLVHARARVEALAGRHDVAADVLAQLLAGAGARPDMDPGDPRWTRVRHDHANALRMLGRLEEARAGYERVIAETISAWGPDHPRVADARLNLGGLLVDLGQLERAHAEIERAAAIYRAIHGDDSLALGHAALALARLEMYRGRYREALDLADRGLALYDRHLERGHARRAEAVGLRGALRFLTGDVTGALSDYRAALILLEQELGAGHVDAGLMHGNIGEALLAQGERAAAVPEIERSLAILEAGWGPSHPELAFPLKLLGLARLGAGHPALAVKPLERALSLRSTGDPQEIAEIQWALARALAALGRDPARRRRLAQDALSTYRAMGSEWQARAREIARWLAR